MSTSLRLAAALVASVIGLTPVLAQPAPPKSSPKTTPSDAELKALEEKLQKLVQELREQELKKATRPETPRPVPAPPTPAPVRPTWVVPASPADATSALRGLVRHSDPKIAALAAELLERLAKVTPPVAVVPAPRTPWKVEVLTPPGSNPAPPTIEFKPTPRMIVIGDRAPAPTASSLKLSTDGKTAAVVGADGGVVVYDVASGRELMRFPGKK